MNLSVTNLNSDLSNKCLGESMENGSKFEFREHLQNIFKKFRKTIGLLSKLQNNLPRASSLGIYKLFLRSHLVYGRILRDQKFNNSFHDRFFSNLFNIMQYLP